MAAENIMGIISFINHDKDYATIDYTLNGKKKSINGNISEKEQLKLKAEKIIKRIHQFHVGDEVTFIINLSARGDKMVADCIEFRFNNALDNLINKSAIENRFVGYLKKVDDGYFVKETGSYIFFELKLSPWERRPQDSNLNEPYFFKLENVEKPDKATAAPYKSLFIPEYLVAMQHFKNRTTIDATITKVTAHGVYVNVLSNKIAAKIPVAKNAVPNPAEVESKIGDSIKVFITYLSSSRIIIERAQIMTDK